MKKYIRLFLQVAFALLVYFMLASVLSDTWLIIIFVAAFIFILWFTNRGGKDHTYCLDLFCDVNKHLMYTEKKLKGKKESLYILYKAYGDLYNGETEGIEEQLHRINIEDLKIKDRYIFEEVKLKLLYNNKDIDQYSIKLTEINNGEFKEIYQNELLILKGLLYLLEEKYDELVELMFEIIPKQKESYRVIELEYYLALAYIAQDKDEDAVAVLEFITKRDFKIYFVTKGKELLDQLQPN